MASVSQTNLKNLSNHELLAETHRLVQEERRIGTLILHRLKEISHRRLYGTLGYSSLFTYLVQELKYSEACAYRLNNAMKLLTEVPEVEHKIQSGDLSVTTVAQVQSYCQAQTKENGIRFKTEDKKEILKKIEGSSKRKTEKILASLHPESPLPMRDLKKPVASNQTKIQFVAHDELVQKLDRIKDLTAHKKLAPSFSELLDLMAEIVLEKIDPLRKAEKLEKKSQRLPEKVADSADIADSDDKIMQTKTPNVPISTQTNAPTSIQPSAPTLAQTKASRLPGANDPKHLSPGKAPHTVASIPQTKKTSRYIPARTRRAVWHQAQGQCCFISRLNGRRCTETAGLEIEHQLPFALGGTHELSNLKLLCKKHNLLTATQVFGEKKMRPYLRRK